MWKIIFLTGTVVLLECCAPEAEPLHSWIDEDILKHKNKFILPFLISSFRQSRNISKFLQILYYLRKIIEETINITLQHKKHYLVSKCSWSIACCLKLSLSCLAWKFSGFLPFQVCYLKLTNTNEIRHEHHTRTQFK